MSDGPICKNELDALLSQTIVRYAYETLPMTSQEIIEVAKGLVQGAKSSGMTPPFRILVPHDTNLQEHWEGENHSLEERLKDIPDVKEVKVARGRGVSIESIGAEDGVRKTDRGG